MSRVLALVFIGVTVVTANAQDSKSVEVNWQNNVFKLTSLYANSISEKASIQFEVINNSSEPLWLQGPFFQRIISGLDTILTVRFYDKETRTLRDGFGYEFPYGSKFPGLAVLSSGQRLKLSYELDPSRFELKKKPELYHFRISFKFVKYDPLLTYLTDQNGQYVETKNERDYVRLLENSMTILVGDLPLIFD